MRPLLRLALLPAIAAALCLGAIASAAPRARLDVGVYASDVARFDRLTGQHSDSAATFLGWDQGRTWGSRYSKLPRLARRPAAHRAEDERPREAAISTKAIALGLGRRAPDGPLPGDRRVRQAGDPAPSRRDEQRRQRLLRLSRRACELDRVVPARVRAHLHRHARRLGSGDEREAGALGMPGVSVDVPPNPYPHMTVVWNPLAVGVHDDPRQQLPRLLPGRPVLRRLRQRLLRLRDVRVRPHDRPVRVAYPDKPFVIDREWGMAVDDPTYVRRLRRLRRAATHA